MYCKNEILTVNHFKKTFSSQPYLPALCSEMHRNFQLRTGIQMNDGAIRQTSDVFSSVGYPYHIVFFSSLPGNHGLNDIQSIPAADQLYPLSLETQSGIFIKKELLPPGQLDNRLRTSYLDRPGQRRTTPVLPAIAPQPYRPYSQCEYTNRSSHPETDQTHRTAPLTNDPCFQPFPFPPSQCFIIIRHRFLQKGS